MSRRYHVGDHEPPSAAPRAGGAGSSQAPSRVEDHEPLIDAAPPGKWRAWLVHLATSARVQVAEASALLVATIVLAAGALWLFGDLADQVSEGRTRVLDENVYHWLRQFASPALDEAAGLVSLLGAQALGGILALVLLYFAWRRRWGAAVSIVLVTGGAQLLNDVLKDHFRRTRPAPIVWNGHGLLASQTFSFPSGHAMVSAAFYLFLVYLGWRLLRARGRLIWTCLLVALILLIGLSRLYLGAHYLTDVAAGYAAGGAWTEAVVVAGRLLAVHRSRRRRPRLVPSSVVYPPRASPAT